MSRNDEREGFVTLEAKGLAMTEGMGFDDGGGILMIEDLRFAATKTISITSTNGGSKTIGIIFKQE